MGHAGDKSSKIFLILLRARKRKHPAQNDTQQMRLLNWAYYVHFFKRASVSERLLQAGLGFFCSCGLSHVTLESYRRVAVKLEHLTFA